MKKTKSRKQGKAKVTFVLPAAAGGAEASVCGEWNDWAPGVDVMTRDDGGFTATVELEVGRAYRFKYLLDGERWVNAWAADAYVPNDHGGDDSLVDLTDFQGPPPKASAKKK